jgi:hypothetical protein
VLVPDDAELERIAAQMPKAEGNADGGVFVGDPSQNQILLQIDPK